MIDRETRSEDRDRDGVIGYPPAGPRDPARHDPAGPLHGIVGTTAVMRGLFRRIEAVAAARSTVLIIGESGTGKELVARAIHRCGTPYKPFVPFNCAAIPRDLVESELFGHRRGAFSGAHTDHPGLLRAADGGTVFLDEITEMSPDLQAKLLRAIQERTVRPVGATSEIPINLRIVASSNRDPEEAVRSGRLRADLYYRLQVNVLEIPPLRDRADDVVPLVSHFLRLLNERSAGGRTVQGVDSSAMEALRAFAWPGNVRELSNTLESAFTFGTGSTVTLDDLPVRIVNAWREGRQCAGAPLPVHPASCAGAQSAEPVGSYAQFEREAIARALIRSGGNKVHAARLLKISRKKLYDRIERYGLAVVRTGADGAAARVSAA